MRLFLYMYSFSYKKRAGIVFSNDARSGELKRYQLFDDVAEVEVGKFKVVESHSSERVVKLDGFGEV